MLLPFEKYFVFSPIGHEQYLYSVLKSATCFDLVCRPSSGSTIHKIISMLTYVFIYSIARCTLRVLTYGFIYCIDR